MDLILKDVLYAPRMMYTLISSSTARRCGLRTVIDNDNENPLKGILKMINKSTGGICMIGRERKAGLYEADLTVVQRCKSLV